MTFKESERECFVYQHLPGAVEGVVAGRLVLQQDRRGNRVGRFVYARSYLERANAVEIDPVELKLSEETFQTARFGGVFSSLRDAGPDYWGRFVIERHSGRGRLDELDFLLESPDDRAGALGFGLNKTPPAPMRKFNKTIHLEKMHEIADRLLREEIDVSDPDEVQTSELLLVGTSMGGARPKTVVEDETGLWIAKFSRPDDRWNNPRVEHAMLELARGCGLSVARSRIETVGGKDVLLVQRFDRTKVEGGYSRSRMLSCLTVLRAEESVHERDRWSYILLAEELRRIVAEPKKDAEELFRRVCFNALISNIDDHPRNHALLGSERDWRLSPSYDLTPSPAVSTTRRDLAMICGSQGRFANAANILSECTRFLLNTDEAGVILSTMTEQVRSSWYGMLKAHGVSERDAETVRNAFVYDGFLV